LGRLGPLRVTLVDTWCGQYHRPNNYIAAEAGGGDMQQITHSECIFAPGAGALVEELFKTLGFTVIKVDTYPYIIAQDEPDKQDVMTNCIYACELTPVQQAFEKTLREQLAASSEFRSAAEEWESDFRNDPQRSVHFGFRYETREDFEAAIE